MIKWFHNRKITKFVEAAQVFVNENYTEPPKPNTEDFAEIRFSQRKTSDDSPPRSPGVSFQMKRDPSRSIKDESESSHGEIRYSERIGKDSSNDKYDIQSIDSGIQELLSFGTSSKALHVLEERRNMSFVEKMIEHIKTKDMRDPDVYKAAQVDRRLFSKLVSDYTYKPAKDTCIAISLGLQLSLSEANDLLARAGYVLSHSCKRDIVIEYFFREHIYNLDDANEILFRLGQKLIGR